MHNTVVNVIGYSASFLSMIAFLPQTIYVIKTRDTKSLSLGMYGIFVVSVALWLVYGVLLQDILIIISNLICTVLAGVILVYKLREV